VRGDDSPLFLDRDELRGVAREVLGRGGELRFRATGRSMHPAIRDLELVTVAPVGGGGPRIGEIVLYQAAAGRMILHRVVGLDRDRDGDRVRVRGDARPSTDEWIALEAVVGRVVAIGEQGPRRQGSAP